MINVLYCLEILKLDAASHYLCLVSSAVCVSIIDIFFEKHMIKNPDCKILQLKEEKRKEYMMQVSKNMKQISDRYHNLAFPHCMSEFYKNRTNTVTSDANFLLNIIKHLYLSQCFSTAK